MARMLSSTSHACCVKGSVTAPRGGPAGPEEKEEEAAATAAACMEDEEEGEDDKGGAVVGARLATDTAVRQVPVTSIWLLCVCKWVRV